VRTEAFRICGLTSFGAGFALRQADNSAYIIFCRFSFRFA
jgi:hypothetical protein